MKRLLCTSGATAVVALTLLVFTAWPTWAQWAQLSNAAKLAELRLRPHLGQVWENWRGGAMPVVPVPLDVVALTGADLTPKGAFLRGFVKTDGPVDEAQLAAIGVEVNTRAGWVWTVRVPVQALQALRRVPGVQYIDLDLGGGLMLDAARSIANIDSVHYGLGLAQKYYGDNVVIGVVDYGFDYTHPTFMDSTGTQSRVVRVWNHIDTTGTPPAGFSYGTELATPAAIAAAAYSSAESSHGTHVTSIAAGSGFGNGYQMRGAAPAAEIVMVQLDPWYLDTILVNQSGVLDGVNYVFQYAQSVGKPAVVNLSLGGHLGPHNGTSLFDQGVNSISGQGKIVVGSAGNSGQDNMHVMQSFAATQPDTVITALRFMDQGYQWRPYGRGELAVWGAENQEVKLALYYYTSAGVAADSTVFFSTATGGPAQIVRLRTPAGDSAVVFVTGEVNPLNNQPTFLLNIYNYGSATLGMAFTANGEGDVHAWISAGRSPGTGPTLDAQFSRLLPGGQGGTRFVLLDGNSQYTTGEFGGSAERIITVGAMVSKPIFTNLQGQDQAYSVGQFLDIANFSSRGPAADGRIKPDITAPGAMVVAAISSYHPSSSATASDVVSQATHNGRTYYNAAYAGTSMSSPLTAGTVALLLQVDPNLTPEQAKAILQNTATQDVITGAIPAGGSTTWGAGKLNAWAALRQIAPTSVADDATTATSNLWAYPNPTTGSLSLMGNVAVAQPLSLQVNDVMGRTVWAQDLGNQQGNWAFRADLTPLSPGLYIATVRGQAGYQAQFKLQIMR